MEEAWILSILSPNADEQAANQLQSSESRGNTVGKIKTAPLDINFTAFCPGLHFQLVLS